MRLRGDPTHSRMGAPPTLSFVRTSITSIGEDSKGRSRYTQKILRKMAPETKKPMMKRKRANEVRLTDFFQWLAFPKPDVCES